MNISNQKILIVGGGSGMGLALARRCVEAGAKVIIAGRGEDRLQQAREALGNPSGLEVAAVDRARLTIEPQQILGDRLQRQSCRREVDRLGGARDVAAACNREEGLEQSRMHRVAEAPIAAAAFSENCRDRPI